MFAMWTGDPRDALLTTREIAELTVRDQRNVSGLVR
jgi:hypothetical protein